MALTRYALLYINWTAANVAANQRQLAAISLGQARAQALQAAASLARDPELTKSAVSNTGTVVAIERWARRGRGLWVLVTREQTTGQGDYAGLPPTLHVIYAQLTAHRKRMGRDPMAAPELTRSRSIAGRGLPDELAATRGVAVLISELWVCAGSRSRRRRHSLRSRQWPGPHSGPRPDRTRRSTHLWTRSHRSC